MRYLAFACDYDGTLASEGRVASQTVSALEQILASGRKLIFVTGRELGDLLSVFSHLDLFEWVVAENGALLCRPADKLEGILGEAPPEQFVAALCKRQVDSVFVGRVVVATWKPHESVVLETIRDLGLELQVIFHKEAVMVLPVGINKASGLEAVVKELGLSLHNVVGDLRAGSDTKAAPAQRRDEFPVGYSLAGLLSSRADLRFANCVASVNQRSLGVAEVFSQPYTVS